MNILVRDVVIHLYSFIHDEDKFNLALLNNIHIYINSFIYL